jgi:hypothetical protein
MDAGRQGRRSSAATVAVVTTPGLKDPGAGGLADDVPVIEPTLESLERALKDACQFSSLTPANSCQKRLTVQGMPAIRTSS